MRAFGLWKSIAFATVITLTSACVAQQKSPFAGDYEGVSGPMKVLLHLTTDPKGALTGTVDSPSSNVFGSPLADVHVNGQSLSFSVPAAHGSWVGFIDSGGNQLSGTWSQGNPFALSFNRLGTTPANTPVIGPPPPATATPTSTSSACPAGSLANYWDGNGWVPLKQVVQLPRERGISLKAQIMNPLSPNAAYTTIYRYKGESAELKLTGNPKFCFASSPNTAPQVVIGQLDVKDGVRQIEVKSYQKHETRSPFPDKKTFDAQIEQSANSMEATSKTPLPPGQYLISNGLGFYDFAVQ